MYRASPLAEITDQFGRTHDYLRISLTERCNLRCFYCMPADGIELTPSDKIMTASEIIDIAHIFTNMGVRKIRLTGGEPLVRKDFNEIVQGLSKLNVELAITTNGVLIDKKIKDLLNNNIKKVNVSLDTLNSEKFRTITRRNYFEKVKSNIDLLLKNEFDLKINVVVVKDINDDELIDFIELTKINKVGIQFIEFMPFKKNEWEKKKIVSSKSILDLLFNKYRQQSIEKINDNPNDTSLKYKVSNYVGYFGLINTITNPFCDTCNRIRLTADGKIKNCLFSKSETDLLSLYRNKINLEPFIRENIFRKFKSNSGINFSDPKNAIAASLNRSMVAIGG